MLSSAPNNSRGFRSLNLSSTRTSAIAAPQDPSPTPSLRRRIAASTRNSHAFPANSRIPASAAGHPPVHTRRAHQAAPTYAASSAKNGKSGSSSSTQSSFFACRSAGKSSHGGVRIGRNPCAVVAAVRGFLRAFGAGGGGLGYESRGGAAARAELGVRTTRPRSAVAVDGAEDGGHGLLEPDGIVLIPDYGDLLDALTEPGQMDTRRVCDSVRAIPESPQIEADVIRLPAAQHPGTITAVFQRVIGRHVDWQRDGERLLRRHKPRSFTRTRLPASLLLRTELARGLAALRK